MSRTRTRFAGPSGLVCAVLSLGVLGALPSTASAGGVADEAEINFQIGIQRFEAGEFRDALSHFLASNRLAPNGGVQFNIARTFEQLGQFVEAYRWYVDAREGVRSEQTRASVQEAITRLAPRVALVSIVTDPPGATVYVDRRELGSVGTTPLLIALPPGPHNFTIEADGHHARLVNAAELRVGARLEVNETLERMVGTVSLTTADPAEVRVDDAEGGVACTTPCELELPPGSHIIYFDSEHLRYPAMPVTVVESATAELSAVGSPRVGGLVVTADEADSVVQLDGRTVGFTPLALSAVPVGDRRVTVLREGFSPIERVVHVVEGEQLELTGLRMVPTNEVRSVSRTVESVDDAPASVSIVSSREIEAFQYPTIAEALRGLRGVALSNDTTYDSVSVRGLGLPNDYGNRLLILQDGAVLNDNILYQSYTGFDGRVDLGDVDHIEFVRGPGSVLYGTGAVSGLVNLIPRSDDRPTGGGVQVGVVRNNVARGRGALHVDLDRGGIDASLSGAYGGGNSLTLTDPSSSHVDGANQFWGLSSAGRVYVGDVRAQWLYTSRSQHIPTGAFGTTVGDNRTVWRDERFMGEVRYEPALGSHAHLFLRSLFNSYRFDGSYEYPADDSNRYVSQEAYRGMWLVEEARVILEPRSNVRITLGAEAQLSIRANLDGNSYQAPITDPSAPLEHTDRYLAANNPYRIFAGYGALRWSIHPRVLVDAGVRADAWSIPSGSVGFAPRFAVNPRVALIVRPAAHGVLKFMAGRAFRAPTIYELRYGDGGVTQVPSNQVSGNVLAPEAVWSGEIEYSHRIRENWVVLASAHMQRAANFIVTKSVDAADPASAGYYANDRSVSTILGGDLEVRREWRSGWMMSANYGYLFTHAGGTGGALANAPSHFGSARTVVPLGSSHVTLAFRTTLEAPRPLVTDPIVRTSWNVVSDLVFRGLALDSRIQYTVGVYNMFDSKVSLPTADSFAVSTMPQVGRNFNASVAVVY